MKAHDISYNFSVAKVLSILMVFTGHYFEGTILWIPTTIALFIFGFSSGYFTSQKYKSGFSIPAFWNAKIIRMGYELLVINTFLLSLFLVQNKTGVFSWQTIPAMLGFGGIFSWLSIPNTSPFGAGLWFFTVLWLFYLTYPLINRIFYLQKSAVLFTVNALIVTIILDYAVLLDYQLWLTIFSFIFGVYVGRYGFQLSPKVSLPLLVCCLGFMVALNLYWHNNTFNPLCLIVASILTALVLINFKLPQMVLNKSLLLSGCIMEIYFIHFYLLIHDEKYPAIFGYLLSLSVTVIMSLLLSAISDKLKLMLNKKILIKNTP